MNHRLRRIAAVGRCSTHPGATAVGVLLSLTLGAEPVWSTTSAPATADSLVPTQRLLPAAVPGCPDQGGILDSVSVPVGDPLDLRVVLGGGVAPEGGATFQLSSDDPTLVAAGDQRKGFLPEVTVPEGETTSNAFTVFGIRVGGTTLRAASLTPGFTGFAVPITAWDVGTEGAVRFLDANHPEDHCRTADDSPLLSTDEARLAECGRPAEGIVADGVSRLLMRARAGLSGTACFEIISSGAADQGILDPAVKTTTNIGSNLYQASSYYTAPLAFGASNNSREVEVEFTYTPAIGNGNTTRIRAETTIVRPPVTLVHGIWTDSAAWRNFFIRNDNEHTTVAGDYEATNDNSFSDNVPRVREFIADAVAQSRTKGYATTQADVVAHSMGGLLSRLFAQDESYRRADNLEEGDIHRLLTLNTPHFGSNFANLIVALHEAEPDQTEETVGDIVSGEVDNGAVCDLAENSPALQALAGGTDLPAHVITSTGGPDGSEETPALYWGGVGPFSDFEAELTARECVRHNLLGRCVERGEHLFPQDIVDGHRFREPNDAIVPISSQRGGFDAGDETVDNYAELLHFGATFVHGVTNTQAVGERALALLDETADANTWSMSLDPILADGTGAPLTVPGIPDRDDAEVYTDRCAPGRPLKPAAAGQDAMGLLAESQSAMNLAAVEQGDPRLRILEPMDGDIFVAGSPIDISVAVDPPLEAIDIRIRMPGLGRLEGTNLNDFGYEGVLELPSAFVGPITLIPAITDANGQRIEGDAVTIAVQSAEAPDQIYFIQSDYMLDLDAGEQGQLRLIGAYADGSQRDLTSSATGTNYASTDPAVVVSNSEGLLTPIGAGVATVTAEHFGLTKAATVRVIPLEGLPATEVTSILDVNLGGLRLNRRTGFFVQRLTITNPTDKPVPGPLYVVLGNLPNNVEPIAFDGITQDLLPVGSPYIKMPLIDDGLNLAPSASVSLVLEFLNPERRRIQYDLSVVRSMDTP